MPKSKAPSSVPWMEDRSLIVSGFSSKEQASFNFMAAVTIKVHLNPSAESPNGEGGHRQFTFEQQYHSKIDDLIDNTVKEIISLLVSKFVSVLEGVLSKLSRYDEGTFFSSILSFTVKAAAKYVDVPKPGMDLADTYIMFVRQNQDILREKVNEEMYIEKLFDQWYSSSMKVICVWLADRLDLQLHIYQLKTLIKIVKKTYRDFRLQGVLEGTLNSKTYDTLHRRLTVEEATASVSEGGGLQGITMKDSDEEEEG